MTTEEKNVRMVKLREKFREIFALEKEIEDIITFGETHVSAQVLFSKRTSSPCQER